jgi:predicted PurR-regulated permease PerM
MEKKNKIIITLLITLITIITTAFVYQYVRNKKINEVLSDRVSYKEVLVTQIQSLKDSLQALNEKSNSLSSRNQELIKSLNLSQKELSKLKDNYYLK